MSDETRYAIVATVAQVERSVERVELRSSQLTGISDVVQVSGCNQHIAVRF